MLTASPSPLVLYTCGPISFYRILQSSGPPAPPGSAPQEPDPLPEMQVCLLAATSPSIGQGLVHISASVKGSLANVASCVTAPHVLVVPSAAASWREHGPASRHLQLSQPGPIHKEGSWGLRTLSLSLIPYHSLLRKTLKGFSCEDRRSGKDLKLPVPQEGT